MSLRRQLWAQGQGDRMKTAGEKQKDIMTFSTGPILQPTGSKPNLQPQCHPCNQPILTQFHSLLPPNDASSHTRGRVHKPTFHIHALYQQDARFVSWMENIHYSSMSQVFTEYVIDYMGVTLIFKIGKYQSLSMLLKTSIIMPIHHLMWLFYNVQCSKLL